VLCHSGNCLQHEQREWQHQPLDMCSKRRAHAGAVQRTAARLLSAVPPAVHVSSLVHHCSLLRHVFPASSVAVLQAYHCAVGAPEVLIGSGPSMARLRLAAAQPALHAAWLAAPALHCATCSHMRHGWLLVSNRHLHRCCVHKHTCHVGLCVLACVSSYL
jgi:hypothetical protein